MYCRRDRHLPRYAHRASPNARAVDIMTSLEGSFRASYYRLVRHESCVVDETVKATFSHLTCAIQPAPKLVLPTSTILPAHQFHQTTVTAPKPHWLYASPRQSRCRRNASAKHPACFSGRDSGDPSIVKRGFQFRASNSSDLEDVKVWLLCFSLSSLALFGEEEGNRVKSLGKW